MEEGNNNKVNTMAELATLNKSAEYLFWVGSAGSYDDRAKKISVAFSRILLHLNINFAILGIEESDSGDVARRAGNEFLFQMQAMQNIETINMYGVRKIITCDPHDYNVLKNEYPDLGGHYEVFHHSEFIYKMLSEGKLKLNKGIKEKVTYHDPCYLARGNNIIEEPRQIINQLAELKEMKRSGYRALCCGAGGAQMFKEEEKGNDEIYRLRTNDALKTKASKIITACPFCNAMINDGLAMLEKKNVVDVLDLAEIVAENLNLNKKEEKK